MVHTALFSAKTLEREKKTREAASFPGGRQLHWLNLLVVGADLLAHSWNFSGICWSWNFLPFVSARQASKMTPWNPNLVISRPAPKLALLDPPHFVIFCLSQIEIINHFHQMLLGDAAVRHRLHPSQDSAQQVLSQKFASKFRMANTSWRSRLFKTKSTCWSVKCGRSRRKDAAFASTIYGLMDLFVGFPKWGGTLKQFQYEHKLLTWMIWKYQLF